MAKTLQPTLWRTCRVLAHTTRLKMFAAVVREPERTVSAIARQFKLPLPVTSMYLRALEARGFLVSKRQGRWVTYRVSTSDGPIAPLVAAMASSSKRNTAFEDATFKSVTAFTHPRRIHVYRCLADHPQALARLHVATGIPGRALLRHLHKLKTRKFVVYRRGPPGTYVAHKGVNAVGRALAELVAAM